MPTITSLKAREIIDSRGNPTLEVECGLASGATARAAVPSGASTGVHEAHELRDGDKKRYNGLGVLTAVNNVQTEIAAHCAGRSVDQRSLDHALIELDGTPNKSRLGANAILGVSLAFARATAAEQGVELYTHLANSAPAAAPAPRAMRLPQPMFNIINGGKHADSGLDIQEFMIGPVGPATMREKIRAASEIISALRALLKKSGYSIGVGDEGGFAPKLSSNEEALDLIVQAITAAGYTTDSVKIGIDAAASSFYTNGTYTLTAGSASRELSSADMIAWYTKLVAKYPIISIEDGLAEDDWDGFAALAAELGGTASASAVYIVGDDLTVTNVARIATAAEKKAITSVLIKPNQIGTLSETLDAIAATRAHGWAPFMSHRSGETTDTCIADLAVATGCDFIKSGSLARGERVCKYNRLLEIEEHFKSH